MISVCAVVWTGSHSLPGTFATVPAAPRRLGTRRWINRKKSWTPMNLSKEAQADNCRRISPYRGARARAILLRMGYPRRLCLPPDTPGTYHCISRCVCRAWLCGEDSRTGPLRRPPQTVAEDRIFELAQSFASPCTSNFLSPKKSRGCVGLKVKSLGVDSFRKLGHRVRLMGARNSPQDSPSPCPTGQRTLVLLYYISTGASPWQCPSG
jgi:hypothetical protein